MRAWVSSSMPQPVSSTHICTVPPSARRVDTVRVPPARSEEHTSELQSLMRISYAVFCLKKKNKITPPNTQHTNTSDQQKKSEQSSIIYKSRHNTNSQHH